MTITLPYRLPTAVPSAAPSAFDSAAFDSALDPVAPYGLSPSLWGVLEGMTFEFGSMVLGVAVCTLRITCGRSTPVAHRELVLNAVRISPALRAEVASWSERARECAPGAQLHVDYVPELPLLVDLAS